MHEYAARELAHYEEGNVTWAELTNSMILLSMSASPSEYYEELPEELKASILECIEDLSPDPNEHHVIGSCLVYGTGEEVARALAARDRHSFDAHWKMRQYIFGDGVPSV